MYAYVKGQPAGNETMQDLADQIHDGAMAFLRREYRTVSILVILVAALIALAPVLSGTPNLPLGWRTSVAKRTSR